jgi:hypothetical protein
MSFFKKKRHGDLEEIIPGRKYRWVIQNIMEVRGGVLDSPKSKSFEGTSFHFHMMCSTTSTVGFYIHYKTSPIPKYTYCIVSCSGEPLRQHTAHSIPPRTTRCGHWNVCSLLDLEGLQRRSNSEVIIVNFAFDDDSVANTHNSTKWMIPRYTALPYLPLCSGGFPITGTPGVMYHLRIDACRDSPEEAVVVVTTRRGAPPRHEVTVTAGKSLLLQYKPYERDHDIPGGLPRFRIADAKEACGTEGTLTVAVTFDDESNPLAFLNRRGSGAIPLGAATDVQYASIQEGGDTKTYALMEDD